MKVVPRRGLEPPRCYPLIPETRSGLKKYESVYVERSEAKSNHRWCRRNSTLRLRVFGASLWANGIYEIVFSEKECEKEFESDTIHLITEAESLKFQFGLSI